jgi:protein-disulfide isomerase
MPAANASMCANEQGKFWEMHDTIFENMRQLEDKDLEGYAKKVGLDAGRYSTCYKANKYKDQILKDQKTASSLGARGTPAFFINGRFLSGAQPFPAFQKLVDEELKKAKESGIAKAEYYNKAIVGKGQKKM